MKVKAYFAIVIFIIEISLLLAMAHNYYIDDIQRATFDGVLVLVNRTILSATIKAMKP